MTDEDAGEEVDAGRDGPGNCTPIHGECDLVAQDCPEGRQCEPVQGPDGGGTTQCKPIKPSQHLPKGSACCPSTANPCLPGLQCIGPPCQEGKPPSGRCTPACCFGDDSVCGESTEGIPGQCDLTLTHDGKPIFYACKYAQACKPFGVIECPSGYGCRVTDTAGSAGCIQIDGPGKGHGEICTGGSECIDNAVCVASGVGAARCRIACLKPEFEPPFDAGALDGGPGFGGCPDGSTCTGNLPQAPDWYGYCL